MFAGLDWVSFWIGSVMTLLLIFFASVFSAIHEGHRLADRIDAEVEARRAEASALGGYGGCGLRPVMPEEFDGHNIEGE